MEHRFSSFDTSIHSDEFIPPWIEEGWDDEALDPEDPDEYREGDEGDLFRTSYGMEDQDFGDEWDEECEDGDC